MPTLVTVIHILTCAFLILVVLVQSGKGAEISASFGGSSQTVFGSSVGASFFTRLTSILAGIFMVTSVVLTLLGGASKKSLFENVPLPAVPASQQQGTPASSGGANPIAPVAAQPAKPTVPAAVPAIPDNRK